MPYRNSMLLFVKNYFPDVQFMGSNGGRRMVMRRGKYHEGR